MYLQVEAMSSEKNLRVRVKVFDNSTTIYSQDVEIIQGEGTFVVPAMLSDNEIIVLQVSKIIIKMFSAVVVMKGFFSELPTLVTTTVHAHIF